MNPIKSRKIMLISRCAWTLYNFRRNLISSIQNRGNEVISLGATGDGYESKLEDIGIPFIPLQINQKGISPISDLRLLWILFTYYRQYKPDIVHHFTIKPVIYGSIAAYLAGVPRIVNTITGLGYVFTDNSPGWLRPIVEQQYRLALACSHLLRSRCSL